jgi:4-hydroxybenzoate polyprenyltransferase
MAPSFKETASLPLLVKAEGVLISTEVIWESFYLMLNSDPLQVLRLPFRLWEGRGRLAAKLLDRYPPTVENLPYNSELLSYLHKEKQKGRRLVLVTELPITFAQLVADHLGLFDEVISMDDSSTNDAESDNCRAAGARLPADYVYACRGSDGPVVRGARAIVLVGSKRQQNHKHFVSVDIEKRIFLNTAEWYTYFQAVRVHQWLKNLLIFVPLITAHRIGEIDLVFRALCAFFSFSLCASAIYLLNDLVDLSADRQHFNKRNRPLASGRLSLKAASILVLLLLFLAVAIGLYPGRQFLFVLTLYAGLSILYSFWLKKLVIVDVVILALFYIFRIIAGGEAVDIMPSFWLLSFAMFIFFSLALMKRSADLLVGLTNGKTFMEGRGYENRDAPLVQIIGVSSGCMSVLVLALYINSESVRLLYSKPELLWLLCPLFFYWISRVWLITNRGLMSDDPILFTIKDSASRIVALITAIILWLAA